MDRRPFLPSRDAAPSRHPEPNCGTGAHRRCARRDRRLVCPPNGYANLTSRLTGTADDGLLFAEIFECHVSLKDDKRAHEAARKAEELLRPSRELKRATR